MTKRTKMKYKPSQRILTNLEVARDDLQRMQSSNIRHDVECVEVTAAYMWISTVIDNAKYNVDPKSYEIEAMKERKRTDMKRLHPNLKLAVITFLLCSGFGMGIWLAAEWVMQ